LIYGFDDLAFSMHFTTCRLAPAMRVKSLIPAGPTAQLHRRVREFAGGPAARQVSKIDDPKAVAKVELSAPFCDVEFDFVLSRQKALSRMSA
jgi:hypothetical protein